MKPITISERMMFTTVRLSTPDGLSGTGFFFNFTFDNKVVPVLITNKHVINNKPDAITIFDLHLTDENDESGENYKVSFESKWYFHSSHDLCFTFMNPLFNKIMQLTGKKVFYIPLTENLIYSQEKLKELSALEPVVMVGYPNGLWDSLHNFPLFRTGFTSAHPGYDFNGPSIGVVDMACIHGSSGSPIFILNENGYSDKNGNIYMGAAKRLIFLGILFQGPMEIVPVKTIAVQTGLKPLAVSQVAINLGYYIKSYEIIEFKRIIEKEI